MGSGRMLLFLGDNRNVSKDSLFWKDKYIPIQNIIGRATNIVFSFQTIRSIGYVSH